MPLFSRKKTADDEQDKIAALKEQVKTLKTEIEELQKKARTIEHKNKMAEEDIRHMMKIRDTESELKFQQNVVEIHRDAELVVSKVKDEYRDKLEKQLVTRSDDLMTMYQQILQRLPNISMEIEKKSVQSEHREPRG